MSVATSSPTAGSTRRAGVNSQWPRVTASSLASFVVVTALVSLRATPTWMTLPLLGLVLVTVPTAATLAARLSLNGCLLIGWSPLMWMVRWPVPVDHGAVLLGLAAAVVAGAVTREPDRRAARALLVPRVRPADAMIGVAAVASLVAMHRLLFVRGPQSALTVLLAGYDNAGHFDMFHVLWNHGAMLEALGRAPDGTPWSYDHYPQGFHALLATLLSVSTSGSATGPQLLVPYCQGLAIIVVLATVIVTAAICSLPGIADRPAVCLPVVTTVLTALLWQPGARVVFDAFGNFWLATAMGGCGLLLALAARERPRVVEVAAVTGTVLAVALAWAPLLAIVWISIALVSGVFRRDSWSWGGPLAGRLAVLLVGGVVVLREAHTLLTSVQASQILTAGGQIDAAAPLPLLTVVIAAVYVCATAGAWSTRRSADLPAHVVRRMRLSLCAPVSAVLVAGLLVVSELHAAGQTSYYFLKLCLGIELILVPLTAGVAGMLVAGSTGPARRSGWLLAAGVAVASTLALGWGPLGTSPVLHAPPSVVDDDGVVLPRSQIARGVLDAVDGTPSGQSLTREYLAVSMGRDYLPFLPATWFHSLGDGMTARTTGRERHYLVRITDPATAAPVVIAVLRDEPAVVVVVSPDAVEPLRDRLAPSLASRVVSW